MNGEPYYVTWEGRSKRQLAPGVSITIISGEKLMLSRVELDAGAEVPEHQHPHEQFGFVIEGDVAFSIGGEQRRLRAGDYYAIPGGVPHSVVCGSARAVCMDIFSPPREEYRESGRAATAGA